jgi:SAM-dependent methyltransferase
MSKQEIIPEFLNRKRTMMIAHRGNNVLCPICGCNFDKFGEIKSSKRKNVRCYCCGAFERHRLLWKYFQSKTNLFDATNKHLLHFAPEEVFYDIFSIMKQIQYVPCDLTPDKYYHLEEIKVVKVDITNIPFDDSTFDVVICLHVLEHIPNDRLAMSELYRVMKKGAWAVLQVPIDYNRKTTYEDFTVVTPEERTKAFGQYDHVRWYGKDYPDRLKSVGFDVIEDNFVKTFSDSDRYKYGFSPSELIYFCRK